MNLALRQFQACLRSWTIQGVDLSSLPKSLISRIENWHALFLTDINGSRLGYPKQKVRRTPDLEDELLAIAHECLGDFQKIPHAPAICLTHDVDYIAPTQQLKLKAKLGRRKQGGLPENYLDSILKLLKRDEEAAEVKGASTVFLAHRISSGWKNPLAAIASWIVDPSYAYGGPDFEAFSTLLREFDCELGIHGSFFSLRNGMFEAEKNQIESLLKKSIKSSRQHWLRLPDGLKSLKKMRDAGIKTDSTLGWNGDVGFRGGMSRPYPLVFETGPALFEVPMLLMDGPLFDDLKLEPKEVFELGKEMLETVFARGGCVALNWHDRSAIKDLNWFEGYDLILNWAKSRGFRFLSLSAASEAWLGGGTA